MPGTVGVSVTIGIPVPGVISYFTFRDPDGNQPSYDQEPRKRADFDHRHSILQQFPKTFSVPTRFAKHTCRQLNHGAACGSRGN